MSSSTVPKFLRQSPEPPVAPQFWEVSGEVRRNARVRIDGFKHLLVPTMAVACLSHTPWQIDNAPDIADTRLLTLMLRTQGAQVSHDVSTRRVTIDASSISSAEIPPQWSQQVHGGIYLLPALLASTGHVVSRSHGGCCIGAGTGGSRPIEHIAAVMQRFGAHVVIDGDRIEATAPPSGLRGTRIDLADFATVDPHHGTLTGPYYSGATKTAVLLAATARGTTILHNPYPKPDVIELARLLSAAGVAVRIDPQEIEIHGCTGSLDGVTTLLPSDLMEVMSFVALSVAARRPLQLQLDRPELVQAGLAPELAYLHQMGVNLTWQRNMLTVGEVEWMPATDIHASSHLIYSDAQPLFALMLLGADKPCTLTDSVWHSRFGYVPGLRALGADLTVGGNQLRVHPSTLRPTTDLLRGDDLRAVSVLVFAALAAGGRHRISGVQHLSRGHANLASKLRELGATVTIENQASR